MNALLPLLLAAAATTKTDATWLARVNDEVVTPATLQEQFVSRHGGHTKFLAGEVEARKFLEIVIDQRLLVQEAYRLELDRHPDVAERVARFSEEKQVEHLVKTEIEDRAQPTEDEIRAAWETNTTRLYTVLQIVAATREAAEAARARVVGGEDFETVAREVSVAPSKAFGGRMNSVGWGSFPEPWEAAVFALKAGEVTPVLETESGFEVVRLESMREAEKPDLAAARSKIEGILKARKLAERRRLFSEELWTRHHAQLTPVDARLAALRATCVDAPDTVLATWDGGRLLAREIAADVKTATDERAWRDTLRALINRPLAALDAKRRNVAAVPAVASVVRAREEQLMESVLYADYVLKDVKVADEQVKAWYEAHRDELARPERRHIAQILLPDAAAAEAARKEIADGSTSFEDVARARSLDRHTAPRGGDLGWIERTAVPAKLAGVLTLPSNGVSAPMATKLGVHLFKVLEIEPPVPMPFEEAEPKVRKRLLEDAQRAARTAWVKQLRAAARVQVNDRGVRAFVRDAEQGAAKKPAAAHDGP